MATRLTAAAVARLLPDPTKRLEIGDSGCPGLRLVISPSGAKSWAFRFKLGGRAGKLTIGTVETHTLAEARDAADEARKQVARGIDPAEAKKASKRAAVVERERAASDTFAKVLDQYLREHVSRLKSSSEVERLLRKETAPWASRDIRSIDRRDVRQLLDAIMARPAPTTARLVHANLRRLWRWAAEREIAEANPIAAVSSPAETVTRDRVLGDDELRLVLIAAERMSTPWPEYFATLAFTGQRREEVAGMRWDELDLVSGRPLWRLEGGRTKNARPHDVPLAPAVVERLAALPRIRPAPDAEPIFAMSTTGTTPISGFSRARSILDRHMLAVAREEALARGEDPASVKLKPWRVHDLRRTVATGMAEHLGIAPHVVEAVLNHVSGSKAGVAGIYNRATYANEKRAALNAWAARLAELRDGRPAESNVRRLR